MGWRDQPNVAVLAFKSTFTRPCSNRRTQTPLDGDVAGLFGSPSALARS